MKNILFKTATFISLLLALFIGIIACTSENTADGSVAEENSVAQTWETEVAVDSVKYQWESATLDPSPADWCWHEIIFTTQSKFIYEYYGKNADACVLFNSLKKKMDYVLL